MGASGTATLDFGAFPGASDASVVITGQGSILSGSLVEAWIFPAATADHTADEHRVESLQVCAGSVVAATGFTIFGVNTSQIGEPVTPESPNGPGPPDAQARDRGGKGTRLYGTWNVAWVWN